MRITLLLLMVMSSLGCSGILRTTLPFNDLPKPTGPYAVGTQVETWRDTNRLEAFTENPDDLRRIVVQYWYPAIPSAQAPMLYIDAPDIKMTAFAKTIGLPRFLVDHIRDVQTHSTLNLQIHPDIKKAPLIVFSHGLGGMKTQNSIQAEELASRGNIVIAADHAFDAYLTLFDDGSTADYRSSGRDISTEEEFWAARGPQLATRTADIRFMLDVIENAQQNENAVSGATNPLWQRVDLNRVGIFGHSFGGATSIMALDSDPRVQAAVVLDGWMVPVPETVIERGTAKPLLYLGQERWYEPLNYEKLDRYVANSAGPVNQERMQGTKHMDFADSPHLSNVAKKIGFAGSIQSDVLKEKLNTDILRFFADHLTSTVDSSEE